MNKQFREIEKKICTEFFVQKYSKKDRIHFEEIPEIKKLLKQEAKNKELTLTQFIRWMYLRYLSQRGIIKTEVDKKKNEVLTNEELKLWRKKAI